MEPTTADSTGLTTDSENLATHVAASERHATVVVDPIAATYGQI